MSGRGLFIANKCEIMTKKLAITLAASMKIALIAGPLSAFGASIDVEVSAINAQRTKLLVKSDQLGDIADGEQLALNKNCSLKVVTRTANKAVLSSEACKSKTGLRKGRILSLTSEGSSESVSGSTSSSGLSAWSPFSTNAVNVQKGFTFGLVNGLLDGSDRDMGSMGIGLSVGYTKTSVKSLGFSTRAIFSQYSDRSSAMRADGNLTYGLTRQIFWLGGGNIQKLSSANDPGFGLQTGLGYQFLQNLAVDLSYVNLGGPMSRVSGVELAIQGLY